MEDSVIEWTFGPEEENDLLANYVDWPTFRGVELIFKTSVVSVVA